jgi:phosphoglycolate phosphatase-like HAD superfamily hydrolase
MLCSNCGNPIRPVVAVDIDGTLGDYHGHFLRFAAEYHNIGPSDNNYSYDGSVSFKTWWCEMFGRSEKDWHDAKLAYRQGGMKRTMPIYPLAASLCREIKATGAELWVTTTRPYLSLDNIVPDTVEWLRRHEIEYDGMLFDEDKYAQLVERVDPGRIVAVIDDLLGMFWAAEKAIGFRCVYLIKNNYNRAIHMMYNQHDMEWFVANIGQLIHSWMEQHEPDISQL